jgi:tryptophan halogenase
MDIKSICIVGGGSAGWITALSILKNLPSIQLTLVESKDIKTVGVGESTQPGVLRFFNEYLNLEERDWMKFTDATYKVGGDFRNFNTTSKSDIVYHALTTQEERANSNVYDWGVKKFKQKPLPNTDYSKTFFATHYMADENKFGKRDNDTWHAFHFDASKFGEYAKDKSLNLGMNYIEDLVTDVVVDTGIITSLTTKENGNIESDFFIDCTGFRSALIGKALGSKFIDLTDILPNDRAIATKVDYDDKKNELTPLTSAQAIENGWCWEIPLWSRIGAGYVYSSSFVSQEKAEEEFRTHLKKKYGDERTKDLDMLHLKMRIGYQETPWKGNCLAVGLSSGFVEPLESTGLSFIIESVGNFIDYMKDQDCCVNNLTRERFNRNSIDAVKEVVNFITMHYLNTRRDDTPYWKHIKDNITPTKYLLDYIHKLESKWVWDYDDSKVFFDESNLKQIVVGFNILNMEKNILLNGNTLTEDCLVSREEEIEYTLDMLKETKNKIIDEVELMSNHYSFLRETVHNHN